MKAKVFLENHDPQIKENDLDNYFYSAEQVVKLLEIYKKQEVQKLNEILTELMMRSQISFPRNLKECQWFEQGLGKGFDLHIKIHKAMQEADE